MNRRHAGFTLVELAIVIVIIAILAAITIFTYSRVQVGARDSTRNSRATIISDALEKYYTKNGEYPSCANMEQSGSTVASLLGIDQTILVTPTASSSTTNSITSCSDLTAGSGSDIFAYVGDGSTACSTGSACAYYKLEYRQESTGTIITFSSQHQAAATPVSAPTSAPVVTAGMSGSNAVGTSGTVTCSVGTPQYQLRYASTNTSTAGSWSSWTSWSTTQLTLSVTASQGYQYSFQAEASCNDGNNTSSSSPVSNTATTVDPIATPVAPTYLSPSSFTNNGTATVNYASYCPTGTSVTNNTFRTQAWTGGQWGPHPWGYLDSWQNGTGSTQHVSYWGKYECMTTYATSNYSPESYNSIAVTP